MISHNYLCQYARDLSHIGGLGHDDRMYGTTPFFHMNGLGMLLASLHTGARVVIDRRFSVSNFWCEIRRSGATVVNLIGAMIPLIANAEDNEDSCACRGQLRRMLGAPFTAETSKQWRERFGVAFVRNTGYGLTEARFVFVTPPDIGELPAGASGICAEHMDARIFDDNGEECPPGVPGELVVRPLRPNVMFEECWKRPAETLRVFKNLWLCTGDLGKINENAWFCFVDGKKDCLRCRGENISSFEMEQTFLSHPAIAEVAVHAVPSEFTEDDFKVTAVFKPDAYLSEEELCRWAVDRVPYFALLRFTEFRNALPYTASGRIRSICCVSTVSPAPHGIGRKRSSSSHGDRLPPAALEVKERICRRAIRRVASEAPGSLLVS